MPWHLSVSLCILMTVKAVDPRDWRRQRGAGQPLGLCGGSQHVLWVDPPKPGQREGKLVPGFPLLLTDLGSSSQGHQAHPHRHQQRCRQVFPRGLIRGGASGAPPVSSLSLGLFLLWFHVSLIHCRSLLLLALSVSLLLAFLRPSGTVRPLVTLGRWGALFSGHIPFLPINLLQAQSSATPLPVDVDFPP